MIETVRPAAAELNPLSETEQQRFTDIINSFDMVPAQVDDANACLYLNEMLNSADLQADKVAELRQARDELLQDFLDRPREAYVAEVLNYARLCENRSLTSREPLGVVMTEFVTSDHERGAIDLHFRISQYPSGLVSVTTEVPLKGDIYEQSLPFYITATSDGEFSVQQKVWHRGGYEYVQLPLDDERAEDRLKRFFLFSTEAVHLAYTRQPEERLAADNKAKYYLLTKKHDLDNTRDV